MLRFHDRSCQSAIQTLRGAICRKEVENWNKYGIMDVPQNIDRLSAPNDMRGDQMPGDLRKSGHDSDVHLTISVS
jgi:hypothetical protein